MATVSAGEVTATFKMIDQLTPQLSKAQAQLKAFMGDVDESSQTASTFGQRLAAAMQTPGSLTALKRDLTSLGGELKQAGTSLTVGLTAPLVALAGGAAKLAIDFESSFAGVRKTVDATEPEFAAMAQAFRGLAKEIPVSVTELNKLGESAGALGIPNQEIVNFAKVMAELGVTTNLTSDEAANAIARIQNIFGAAGQDTDRLASTLVALGNAGASTEKEIVSMSQRIAGAGHSVGLTQAQVLSFASTLASVGINAEAGGTAISRIFLKMNDAVMGGGASLKEFARVAGVSAEEFKTAFNKDAAGATTQFINGLSSLKAAGENTNATMEGLVGKNIILKDTLNRLAGSGKLLHEQLELGNQAWKDNTALTNEANERFKTTESQLRLLWGRIKDVGITIGNALLPAIKTFAEWAGNLAPVVERIAGVLTNLPGPVTAVGVAFLAAVAAVGPLLVALGAIVSGVGALAPLLPVLATAFGVITGPIGLVAAALVALATAWSVWGDDVMAVVETVYTAVKTWLWDKLEPIFTPIADLLSSVGDAFAAFRDVVGLAVERAFDVVSRVIGAVVEFFTDRLYPVVAAIGGWFQQAYETISTVVQAIYGVAKAWLLDRFTEMVGAIKSKIDAVGGFFRGLYEALGGETKAASAATQELIDKQGAHTEAVKTLVPQVAAATKAIKGLKPPLDESKDGHDKAAKAAEAHKKAIDDLADTYTGKKVQAEVEKVSAALKVAQSQGKLTSQGFIELSKDLDDLRRKGAVLTPQLTAMSNAFSRNAQVIQRELKPVFVDFSAIDGSQNLAIMRLQFEGMVKTGKEATKMLNDSLGPAIKNLPAKPPDEWKEFKDNVHGTINQLKDAVKGEFAQILLGAESFKDGMIEIWHSLKASVIRIATELMNELFSRFMKGLGNILTGTGSFGSAFSGILGNAIGGGAGGGAAGAGGAGGAGAGAGAGIGGAALVDAGLIAAYLWAVHDQGWSGEGTIPTPAGDDGMYHPPSGYYDDGTTDPLGPYGYQTAMASGGVVTRPTVALVGEAGPEAVVPLNQWSGNKGGYVYIDARGAMFPDERSMRRFADMLLPKLTESASFYVSR